MGAILTVKDLQVHYGGIQALRGISLSVEKGEIITLIGANGAGKSTTMNAIMGIVPKAAGTVEFGGQAITRTETRAIVRQGLILVPEGRQIFPGFSVKDNLLLGGYFSSHEENAAELEQVFSLFPILKERIHQMGGTLSGGEQQMLAIGRALMAKPQVLMLDEPSLGLAPLIISDIFRLFRKIRDTFQIAILLIEHDMSLVMGICEGICVLNFGQIIAKGTAAEIQNNPEVIRAYLGKRKGG